MSKDNGGPAFPVALENYDMSGYCGEGMTLRDYFAAKALNGLLAGCPHDGSVRQHMTGELWAAAAYRAADAMLAERAK
jgi:hypothetical protein